MKEVCVITGGGSGMGLDTAKEMGSTHYVIICGRTIQKLENAIAELRAEGIECEAFPCDISDRGSVHSLAAYAKERGSVQAVIHAAGMSPHMGDPRKIMEANALGTIHMNTEFSLVMGKGSCILDLSSMAAYLAPGLLMPKRLYEMSLFDEELFLKKMMGRVNIFPKKLRSGVAYAISKNFVIWYAKKSAALYGHKDIRVVCVSPGNFETPMGKLEEQEAQHYMNRAAVKRFGKPEEIAYLLAAIVNKRNSYLTGVDILCDGGLVAGIKG
jgi:NAD(P)-dependent dehydrogenase (short-subunit alcohol dehydrogenase family)